MIVLTCFVVGLRLMMYSAAMAPHLKPLPAALAHALAFLLTDQAFAAAIRRFRDTGDTRSGASYFLGTGVLLWIDVAGRRTSPAIWLGNVLPAAWSLDFVVPLCFLALLVPALEDRPDAHRRARRRGCRGRARRAADAAVADLRRADRHRGRDAGRTRAGRDEQRR